MEFALCLFVAAPAKDYSAGDTERGKTVGNSKAVSHWATMRLAAYKKWFGCMVLSLAMSCLLCGWGMRSTPTRTFSSAFVQNTLPPPSALRSFLDTQAKSPTTVRPSRTKSIESETGQILVENVEESPVDASTVGKDSDIENHVSHMPSFRRISSVNRTNLGPYSSFVSLGKTINTSASNGKAAVSADELSDIDPRLLMLRTSSVSKGDDGQCKAHNHVAFLKVHKAASSTVANVLQRYGFTRQLNFALPNKLPRSNGYNYINRAGQPLTSSSLLPPPPGQDFDILWNHAIYNRSAFNAFMPSDTVYVTILREPFEQFVSSFAFYKAPHLNRSHTFQINPFSHYLHYERHPKLLDYFRNKQSEDLGMVAEHVLDGTVRHKYIHQLNTDLNLVMITEYFDQSLVLLRRLLCWNVKDILYMPKNKNAFKPDYVFNSQDYVRHRQLAKADYELYEFFRHKFFRTLDAQGVDFEEEVTHFREMVKQVQNFCQELQEGDTPSQFFVPRSPWSDQFVVNEEDCELLGMPELSFLDMLLNARHEQGDLVPANYQTPQFQSTPGL